VGAFQDVREERQQTSGTLRTSNLPLSETLPRVPQLDQNSAMNVRKRLGSFIAAPFLKVPREYFQFVKPSFSVTGEDLVLEGLLKAFRIPSPGFYVDVGANHPFRCSSTWRLTLRGWRGINIDVSPHAVSAFKKWRPRDVSLCTAVSTSTAPLYFVSRPQHDPFGSGNYVVVAPPTLSKGMTAVQVPTRTLASILDEYRPANPVEFLNVDCEGHDLEVLKSNDWSRHRPLMLGVEDAISTAPTKIERFCAQCGYSTIAFTGLTRFLVRDDLVRQAGFTAATAPAAA